MDIKRWSARRYTNKKGTKEEKVLKVTWDDSSLLESLDEELYEVTWNMTFMTIDNEVSSDEGEETSLSEEASSSCEMWRRIIMIMMR